MKFRPTIDLYVSDMKSQGRINSPRTEVAYRATLLLHADDVDNRDPRLTGRDDVKKTLRRWRHPNTQAKRRSHLISFYRWLVWEGLRPYNPAEQTRPPKMRKAEVYRLTRPEAARLLRACKTERERWAITVGMCAGLRRQELLGLQGRHFDREGFVWVSPDIGKGGRGRHVPVLPELKPVVDEIRASLESDDFMLPAQRWRDPGRNTQRGNLNKRRSSEQALWRLVKDVAKRADISADIGPHALRHSFGDHVARYAGLEIARALMGHADVGTTKAYVGEPSLDELVAAIGGFRFSVPSLSPDDPPANALHAPTESVPVQRASRTVERFAQLLAHLHVQFEPLRQAPRV